MSTTDTAPSIAEELFGKTRQAILALLFCHSDEEYYLREIQRMTGAGMGAVQRELKRLVSLRLVTRRPRGNMVFYQANQESPVFDELHDLMVKTAGVADVLRDALSPIATRIETAFVYGSVAAGTETADSDLDVMVIGRVGLREVVGALSEAADNIGREINPTVYPVAEFKERFKADHHFIKSVLDGAKIFLIGDQNELKRLVE